MPTIRAQSNAIDQESLTVNPVEGRSITVPLAWYARLWYGTAEERPHYEIIGDGMYLHWPDLDEDLSTAGILAGRRSGESQESLKRWLAQKEQEMTTSNMGKSGAVTVGDYLNELPEARRETIAAVRQIILDNLPNGYQELVSWGMISYSIPLERYPDTYNKQPLSYIALASHKSYMTMYLMGVYSDSQQEAWLKEAFAKAGKKLDMGKSCLHFRKLDDLPLDVVAEVVASTPPDEFIARYEASRKL